VVSAAAHIPTGSIQGFEAMIKHVMLKATMFRFLLLAFIAIPLLADFDHSGFDGVLRKHVNSIGEVDYAGLKRDRAELDRYVAAISQTSPKKSPTQFPQTDQQLTFWINAYNALMLKTVINAYPLKSVRDLGLLYGVFRKKEHLVGGIMMSLDDIEHKTIRAQFPEPRIHFALVCASVSCPRLQRFAFDAAKLRQQLDQVAKQFLSEQRNLEVKPDQIILSSIFKWYGGDFNKNGGDLRRFLIANAPATVALSLKNQRFEYRDYDWNLNDVGSRARSKNALEKLVK
jgi:hypothetical protein